MFVYASYKNVEILGFIQAFGKYVFIKFWKIIIKWDPEFAWAEMSNLILGKVTEFGKS